MKHIKFFRLPCVAIAIVTLMACAEQRAVNSEVIVEAPFPMEPITECVFPDRDFYITDYGAVSHGDGPNTAAIAAAIAACNEAGGGRVVVPSGTWLTGAIHLKSNVNLHLEEGAVLCFTDDPADYLPAVLTSWEGMECYNYSPLVYAFDCKNIAITGNGTLSPCMTRWQEWFARRDSQMEAQLELYTMASTGVPVEERQMAKEGYNLRPQLIQLNRCQQVLLDSFKIRDSPFWTIHLLMCDGGIVRNLDVVAHGANNDGIDLEMSRNFLVENCRFDQGDDAVVIKSGRNQDAWRLNMPSENIVVRNCDVVRGHVLLGIGSEMSAGVRNVYLHDCTVPDSVFRLFFVKTNHRRGGFVENIYMKNVQAEHMQRVMEVDTDVLYQWRNAPTYKDSISLIRNLYMENVSCKQADAIYDLKGDSRLPIQHVELRNVRVDSVTKFVSHVENAEDVVVEDVTYNTIF